MSLSIARRAIGLCVLFAACSEEPKPVEQEGPSCSFHDDCPGGVCFQGQCQGTATCLERVHCASVPICAGARCICDQATQRCLPVCVTDDDCSRDGQCLNGVCTKYEPRFNGSAPGNGDRGPLRVGLARVDLDYPVGVSLAGFATRRGPRTPYQDALGGSDGWFDRPDVRAVAFSDGKETWVLLRIPLSWSTDFLLTMTALKVQEKTGYDLSDRIITSAPHSHSHPARFWHLVVGLNFGIFGYDEFSYEVFDRLTTSFADAIAQALESMAPARLGWTAIDDLDPDNKIHRDRREQNNRLPGYVDKDHRALLVRIDDAQGAPIAFLTRIGIHGTVFDYDNPIVTMDAPGGIEQELTRRATAKYGRPVLGVFIQGSAGDVSPAGDDLGHQTFEQVQLVGRRTYRALEPYLDAIETKSEVEVDIVSRHIPITHEKLGYGPNEFKDDLSQCEDSPPEYRYGAFQCVEGRYHDEDPATKFNDGNLSCIFAVECLTAGYPIPQFQKTRLSVARLGDLVLPTMPGEPVSQFGRDIEARVKEAMPGTRGAFMVGYSQDHHFYLLNEDDWLQGGYEPSRDIWGWKLGPYLAGESAKLAADLAKPREERQKTAGNLKPMWWPKSADDEKRVEITETEGDPTEILGDVPQMVERLEIVSFSWRGGHPGLDRPKIVLEAETESGFRELYDDSGFEMLVRYEGTCNRKNCSDHKWRVRWEESRDFALGRYRFRATGRAKTGGAERSYEVLSRTFSVVPSTKLEVYGVAMTSNGIEARVLDPRAVVFEAEGDRRVARPAGHLLRSELVPSDLGTPLPTGMITVRGAVRDPNGASTPIDTSASLDLMSAEPRSIVSAYDASGAPVRSDVGMKPATRFVLSMPAIASGPSGSYVVSLTVLDAAGNQGTATATITK
jgi:neutral ceramidase